MHHECKKCLLLEAGEGITYNEIMQYISTIDKNELVDENTFQSRINFCKNCDYLISGMCRKCGCYVEVRARLKNTTCPNYDNRKW
jgi:predicted Zn-ribbon and HTH transcriptional regulator